ncbi:MAG: o-succinylbenzoate synthase [Planctomycetes bacterium]|nr:o-succinylbenzoate synthase [Planctomycetota bacterium]
MSLGSLVHALASGPRFAVPLTIESVELVHLQIPLKEPFRISTAEVAVKDTILVAVKAEGLVGCGESSPMAGSFYSAETPESCWDDLHDRLVPGVLGKKLTQPRDIATLLAPLAGGSFSKTGLETALWDLLAQHQQKPIAALLGGTRQRVESGLAVGLYDTTEALLERIEQHLPDGYHRVKIKIKPEQDVELVRAVRRRFGDALPLMVDANAAYTIADLAVFQELDRYGLMMFEQPLAGDDLEGLARLQSEVETPVCVDESAETPARVRELLARSCCRIVNIKIQRVGGLGPALEVHDICGGAGVPVWVGCMPELGIGQAAGIHLGSLPGCTFPTDVEPSLRWFVDDYSHPLIEMDAQGYLRVPGGAGLGFGVDADKIHRYSLRHKELKYGIS